MSANFTPTRGAYTELKPFRFWCQKVLPLVYDDSLSYYELLCKVVDYLNKTMEDVETLEDDVTNLFTAYEQLQNYVNTYFDQEFPDLVSDKLDEMAEDGTLTALITPVVTDTIDEQLPGEVAEKIGDTVAGQIGPVVAGQIGGTVSNQIGPVVANHIGPVVADWLEDNMSATTPAVDRTLSILNAAADAAFTGARIENLDDAVGYDHISDVGAIITTADPYAFNYDIIIYNATFSDNQSHTYKMLVIPVTTGEKYRINAHKISIANVSETHFAVTYAFCAKYIGDPDTDTPYYLPTTYNTDAVVDDVVTVPEINIPTGEVYDETTGYLVVITADIQDPVYKVTDGFASESEVTALRDDFNQEISNLNNAIERVTDLSDDLMLSKIVSWEHGTISTSDGTDEGSNTTRARTTGYISTNWKIDVNQNRTNVVYGFYLYYYDANHTFVYRTPYQLYEETHIVPDVSYPYYRIALLNRINYATQDINLYYLPNDFIFTRSNDALTTIKENVDNLVENTKSLYIGELINGHLTASGVVDDSFTEYRLSTPEIVALPSGSFRKIRVKLSDGYLVAMRTGKRSDNLENNLYWYSNGDVITIPDGDNYYAISCCVNEGPPSYVTQKIYPEAAERLNLGLFVYNSSVFKDPEVEKVVNASRLKFDSGSTPNTLKNIAVITHTSDCHGDYTRVKNFFDFSDRIHADLAAVTGDMVSYKPYQKLDWFKGIVNAAETRAAVCVGNHDAYDDTLTDSGVYDLVFDGITSKIGNTTEKTWYYVDLANKALRVISVNLYQYGGTSRSYTHFTDEQLTWLCNTLASTPSGYGVLILYHSPQVDLAASQNYDKFYQTVRKYANTYNAVNGSPINDIVDAFIGRTTITKTYTQTGSPESVTVSGDFTSVDSSVEFIAHLTGHFHQDSVCYVPGTTHLQLMLNVVCTNAIYGGTAYPYLCDLTDLPRNNEDATQNSFNVYAINRTDGVVRITRVGSNTTYTMQKRDYMSIPYKS